MFSCGSLCSVQNKESDTVLVQLPPACQEEEGVVNEKATGALAVEEEVPASTKWIAEKWLFLGEEFVAAQNKAVVSQWKKEKEAEEAEQTARREEEALRLKEEQEVAAKKQQEEERKAAEARRAAEEAAAKEAEEKKQAEAAAAVAAAAEEAEKQAADAAARKATVRAFLKEHGYVGVCAPKRTLMKTTYPLHEAAKRGDVKMVTMLLEEGANKAQKNSRGKTALQRAQQADRKGSHNEVIELLGGVGKTQTHSKVGGA